MKIRHITLKSILSLACAFVLAMSFSLQTAYAQTGPLSLAEVLTGLQSKSGGFTLAEKNSFITGQIQKRGITFRLSTEIESELTRAGASPTLINAVRSKTANNTTPKRVTNPNAVVEFDTAWVDYNVTVEGEKGMVVHTKFTLRNLKDIPLELTVRIQKEDGDVLSSSNSTYRNKGGQLAVFRPIKAGFANAVYQDYDVFIPYNAFTISPGKYDLKLDADIIYPDGDLLKHLTLYPFTFTQPGKTTPTPANNSNSTPSGNVEKMWIDYNVTQDGQKGMLVHTKMTLYNLMGEEIQLVIGVEKADGTKVYARQGSKYRSTDGQLAFYIDLVPKYEPTLFNDVSVFIPYNEIVLAAGNHDLRIHADIIQTDSDLNVHINYFPFTFKSNSTGNYY
ncbi:MAG: hypothetical protein ACR2J3_11005 [Aridibacter sp.]